MVNKLWYQRIDRNYDGSVAYDYSNYRNWIKKFVDLYCYNTFKVPEDITPDNLYLFVEIILKQYKIYSFDIGDLYSLTECIQIYLSEAYQEELYPDDKYLYPDSDRRALADFIISDINNIWRIFPEDVDFVLKCLNCPEEQIVDMYDILDNYFEQFDTMKKSNIEFPRRWEALKRERIEALEKGEPLPIRPMSITLDPCYKEKSVLPNKK